MATVLRSNLQTILPLIKTRIMDVTGLESEAVVYSKQPAKVKPSFQADKVVVLWVRSQITQKPFVAGAGRVDTRVTRRVTVVIWNRLEVDYDLQDEAFFTDANYAIFILENQVLDALATFKPVDAQNNIVVTEPLWIGPVAEPVPDMEGWGHSEVDIEIVYELDLDQSYQ